MAEELEFSDLKWLEALLDRQRMDIRIVNSGIAKDCNDRINCILAVRIAPDPTPGEGRGKP